MMALSRSAAEGLTDSELRATAARQLVAFAAVAIASCIVVQGIGHVSGLVGQTFLYRDRLRDLPRALPVWAASDQPQVLVLGASTVEQEVFTEIIDEELVRAGRPERVFNLGISSMAPDLLPRVVRLVTATYRRAGHRLSLIHI